MRHLQPFYQRDMAAILADPALPEAHAALLEALERGAARAAQPDADGAWRANAWVKTAILAGFRSTPTAPVPGWPSPCLRPHRLPARAASTWPTGCAWCPAAARCAAGAFLAPGVVIMPPAYVNVGAFVDEGTMVDSHALVGSCAQIGKRVHLSAAAQVGGVLEPAGAVPVVVEDDAFVGGLCGLFEGVIVRRRAVLAPGVVLSASTRIYDLVNGRELTREVPEGAVVVPGTRPASGAFAAGARAVPGGPVHRQVPGRRHRRRHHPGGGPALSPADRFAPAPPQPDPGAQRRGAPGRRAHGPGRARLGPAGTGPAGPGPQQGPCAYGPNAGLPELRRGGGRLPRRPARPGHARLRQPGRALRPVPGLARAGRRGAGARPGLPGLPRPGPACRGRAGGLRPGRGFQPGPRRLPGRAGPHPGGQGRGGEPPGQPHRRRRHLARPWRKWPRPAPPGASCCCPTRSTGSCAWAARAVPARGQRHRPGAGLGEQGLGRARACAWAGPSATRPGWRRRGWCTPTWSPPRPVRPSWPPRPCWRPPPRCWPRPGSTCGCAGRPSPEACAEAFGTASAPLRRRLLPLAGPALRRPGRPHGLLPAPARRGRGGGGPGPGLRPGRARPHPAELRRGPRSRSVKGVAPPRAVLERIMSLFAFDDGACADLASIHGTPLFAYSLGVARSQWLRLRQALPERARLAYRGQGQPASHPAGGLRRAGVLLRLRLRRRTGPGARPGHRQRAHLLHRPRQAHRGARALALAHGVRVQADGWEDLERLEALAKGPVAVNLRVHPMAGITEASPHHRRHRALRLRGRRGGPAGLPGPGRLPAQGDHPRPARVRRQQRARRGEPAGHPRLRAGAGPAPAAGARPRAGADRPGRRPGRALRRGRGAPGRGRARDADWARCWPPIPGSPAAWSWSRAGSWQAPAGSTCRGWCG